MSAWTQLLFNFPLADLAFPRSLFLIRHSAVTGPAPLGKLLVDLAKSKVVKTVRDTLPARTLCETLDLPLPKPVSC